MPALNFIGYFAAILVIVLLFLSFHYKEKPIFKFQRKYSGIISLVIGVLGLIFTVLFVKNSIILYLFFFFDAVIGLIQLVKNN